MKNKKDIDLSGDTLDLKSAAAFLKMNQETLRQKADLHEIPGSKPGRAWVFLKDDLISHLRSCYGKKAIKDKITGRKVWVSTNQASIIELELPHRMDDAYNAALGRKMKNKQNNSMTK